MDSIFLKAFFKISKDKPKEKSLLHIWYFFVESEENCCDDLHWMYQLFIPINPAKSIKVFFNPPYESDSHMMNWDFYYFHKSTNNIRVSWRETNRNRDFLSWNINSVNVVPPVWRYILFIVLPPFGKKYCTQHCSLVRDISTRAEEVCGSFTVIWLCITWLLYNNRRLLHALHQHCLLRVMIEQADQSSPW